MGTRTVKATFDVLKPAGNQTSLSSVAVPPINLAWQGWARIVQFGTLGLPGIQTTDKIRAPTGFPGSAGIVQLVATDSSVYFFHGRPSIPPVLKTVHSSNDKYVLDDAGVGVFYNGTGQVPANIWWTAPSVIDSPSDDAPKLGGVFRSDRFRTILMYKPDGADSIWVAVSVLEWDWFVDVAFDVIRRSGYAKNPNGVETSDLPLWDGSFSTIPAKVIYIAEFGN